jgi:hypothetical protein
MPRAIRIPDLPFVSLKEIEIGCFLPPRGGETLYRAGLLPEPIRKAVPGGRPGWDLEALARAAVAGALYLGMPAMFPAARLANALMDEQKVSYSHKETWIPHRISYEPWPPNCRVGDLDGDQFYWTLHRLKREAGPSIYTPGAPRSEDLVLLIADREWVFDRPYKGLSATTMFPDEPPTKEKPLKKLPANPLFRISGWQRGLDDTLEVTPYISLFKPGWDVRKSAAWRHGKAIEEEAVHAYDHALCIVAVNVSLAIRTALDRIITDRIADARAA